MLFSLRSRVRNLEERLSGEREVITSTRLGPKKQDDEESLSRVDVIASPHPFLMWLKEDWLLKLGGFLLLIGFGWFVTYAFLNNWIGPVGRITFGLLCGSAILGLGTWRIQKFVSQGGVFLVIGSTIILLTVFAARQFYGFFTPTMALLTMFLSCAYVAFASVQARSQALSIGSIVLAGIAPLLVRSPTPDFVGLFAYLLVVAIGTVWIVAVTGKRSTTSAALIIIALYSLPELFIHRTMHAPTLLLFAYAFSALFFVTNTVGIVKLKGRDLMADLWVAAGNALFLLIWIVRIAPSEWRSLLVVAWMIVFLVAAFVVHLKFRKREAFYVYASIGVVMLAAATAVELSGSALTIALTIESGMVSVLACSLLQDRKLGERLSLLLLLPIILSSKDVDNWSWRWSAVLSEHFFVLLILAVTALGLGAWYNVLSREEKDMQSSPVQIFLFALGSVYAFGLLWISLHLSLPEDQDLAVMLSLLTYTVVGLVTHFLGRVRGSKPLGIYGGIVLGCVIARLFFVDIWKMEISGRIITFCVIGILLMSTAFFSRKSSPSRP